MSEIEKQFFETFGIEPERLFICKREYHSEVSTQPTCKGCNEAIEQGEYPQITDRILLELICILGNTNHFLITDEGSPIDIDGLKKSVLHSLILQARFNKNKYLKQQIRKLFEEE